MPESAYDVDAEELYIKVADLARENPKEFARKCSEVGIYYRGERNGFNTLWCIKELEDAFGFGATEEMIDALMNYGNIRNNKDIKNTEADQKEHSDNLGIEISARLRFPPNTGYIPSCASISNY